MDLGIEIIKYYLFFFVLNALAFYHDFESSSLQHL